MLDLVIGPALDKVDIDYHPFVICQLFFLCGRYHKQRHNNLPQVDLFQRQIGKRKMQPWELVNVIVPRPLIRATELSPKMHCAKHRRVKTRERRLAPEHVILVAPMSRTHVPASRSFSSSRWAYTFSSSTILAPEEITSTVDLAFEASWAHDPQAFLKR
jgi:hypothetical protein